MGLHFYYGSMNSGKSTSLVQAYYNYLDGGKTALVLKPSVDTREGVADEVVSRIGVKAPATSVSPIDDLFEVVCIAMRDHPYICVLVDEAQFLSPVQVDQLAKVVDVLHTAVICYGLRNDFKGQLFPGSARLFSLADRMEEQRGICSSPSCGKKATHVLRLNEDGDVVREGDQVLVGGNSTYKSTCRKHWITPAL